ncbi:MAG TPA: hypothetical protein DEO70_06510 [Bacteroidales bacterium]|nr:MAG: hypothetical protein A2X11_08550 [Bacteroidetes bacterium GWE2_42_24]OFY25484.1 MAG: hypothetical protein A2X09_14240 [Bacteroidetes bacterium GWF2_43_11]HBZ66471.1 hypothetical protein [Bacteroidales bacterium]
MKQLYILTIVLFFSIALNAQEFKTRLVFSNPAGQTDTLWVGTDARATMGIDTQFGETDIKGPPRNSFDVRASDYTGQDEMFVCSPYPDWPTTANDLTNFETRSMIVPPHCSGDNYTENAFKIIIKSGSFPIHVEWNTSDFSGTCHNGSRLTDAYPQTWWDVIYGMSHGWQDMAVVDHFDYDYTACRYLTPEGDTLHVLHLALVYENAWIIGVEEMVDNGLKTIINPVGHSVRFEFTDPLIGHPFVELYDVSGRLIQKLPVNSSAIEWQSRDGGVFFYRVHGVEKSFSGKLLL